MNDTQVKSSTENEFTRQQTSKYVKRMVEFRQVAEENATNDKYSSIDNAFARGMVRAYNQTLEMFDWDIGTSVVFENIENSLDALNQKLDKLETKMSISCGWSQEMDDIVIDYYYHEGIKSALIDALQLSTAIRGGRI